MTVRGFLLDGQKLTNLRRCFFEKSQPVDVFKPGIAKVHGACSFLKLLSLARTAALLTMRLLEALIRGAGRVERCRTGLTAN